MLWAPCPDPTGCIRPSSPSLRSQVSFTPSATCYSLDRGLQAVPLRISFLRPLRRFRFVLFSFHSRAVTLERRHLIVTNKSLLRFSSPCESPMGGHLLAKLSPIGPSGRSTLGVKGGRGMVMRPFPTGISRVRPWMIHLGSLVWRLLTKSRYDRVSSEAQRLSVFGPSSLYLSV